MRKKLKLITTGEHSAERLDVTLAAWLPEVLGRPVSKAKVRKLIMAGAVHLNGRPVRIPSVALRSGARIEAHIDAEKLFEDSTTRDREFELSADRILFEDEDLIVIDKPPGLPSQPTVDTSRNNLFAALSRFLSRRDRVVKPYVGVHQRLDRDTSGVVLFTKSQAANAGVASIFSNRQGLKIYQGITVRRPNFGSTEWTVRNHLGKIASKSKRNRYGSVDTDGAFAETSFRVIEEQPGGVWIEAIPKTGRTHQIRVHLAEYGLPILGDDLYGSEKTAELASRLMLHAALLRFLHPTTKREICVQSPLPDDFVQCLNRIKTA